MKKWYIGFLRFFLFAVKLLKYVYIGAFAIFLFISLFLVVTYADGYFLYVNSKWNFPYILEISAKTVAILIILWGFFAPKKTRKAQVGYVFLTLIFICFCGLVLLTGGRNTGLWRYRNFVETASPDHKHTIVFYQYSVWGSDSGIIYEKINPIFLKELDKYTVAGTGNVYPYLDSIKWMEDEFYIYAPHINLGMEDGLTVKYYKKKNFAEKYLEEKEGEKIP